MIIKIKDTNVNYVQYGKGKDIILLHGWGQNIEMMDPIGKRLMDNFKITIIDFPGFGNSPEPSFGWTVLDYYHMLDELVIKLKIRNPIIMGHSFGGRVGIIYASMKETNKLVLFGAPFEKRNKKDSLNVKLLKIMKKIPVINKLEDVAKKFIGSTDYKNATPIMRQVVVNTVNDDLTEYAKKIKCPSLLIWGSNDAQVPVEEARRLENLIKDSGLVIFEGLSHYAYLENLNQTISILEKFMEKDKEN